LRHYQKEDHHMSDYIEPNEVNSPRRHWTLLVVLDPGRAGNVALCVGRWDNEPCLGMRWNGSGGNRLGNPQSRGIPTWFIIPDGKYADAIIESLSPEMKQMARNFLPA
jgi:hypothetical protein